MDYKSLYSLHYQNPEQHNAIYQERFHSEAAIHFPFSIKDNPAFCVMTPELNNLTAKIYKTDKKVSKVISSLPGAAISHFTRRCLIDEIVLTNSIEGVNSTRRDIQDILDNWNSKGHLNRFKGLVQKYTMLGNPEKIPLETCLDIRKVYDDLVLDEVSHDDPQNIPDGELFRKSSVSVYTSTGKEIHRGLNPESAIIRAVTEGLRFIHDPQYDLLIQVSVFHYLIGYIHPFYDGNGRLNRFISSYLLSKELEPLTGYRISYTVKENIKSYYDMFKVCNSPMNRGDLTPFVLMFLNLLSLSEEQLLMALQKRKQQLDFYTNRIERVFFDSDHTMANLYYLLIQASLFSENGISTQELLQALTVSRTTLSKRLQTFQQRGLLNTVKDGRKVYYSLNLEALFGCLPEKTLIE